MKLLYFQGKHPNFGDDLNTMVWPKLLPNLFDESEDKVFIGIGSIIGADFVQKYDRKTIKHVMGAGYVSSYHAKPNVNTPDWQISFVRGPRTAAQLGIDKKLGIGDPGCLVKVTASLENIDQPPNAHREISFMPHWESLERGQWEYACQLANIQLIDPRKNCEEVLDKIRGSKIIITEAMHGAIVADALRVPWIPILPVNKVHREKWHDWGESLGLSISQLRIWPTSFQEARLSFLRKYIEGTSIHRSLDNFLPMLSAERLTRLASHHGYLSSDKNLSEVVEKILERVDAFKREHSLCPNRNPSNQ